MTLRFPFGRFLLFAASIAIGQVVSAAESEPHIEDLEALRSGDRLGVSFRIADVFTDQRVESIRSGNPVTFRHVVELVNRRTPRLWPARVVARTRVETSVRYDSLIGQYELVRRTTPLIPKSKTSDGILEETLSTDVLDEVRGWLTVLEDIPVIKNAGANVGSRSRLRVRTVLGRRYWLYVVPARQIVSAERKLEP